MSGPESPHRAHAVLDALRPPRWNEEREVSGPENPIVPTLRVGTPFRTLCVLRNSALGQQPPDPVEQALQCALICFHHRKPGIGHVARLLWLVDEALHGNG